MDGDATPAPQEIPRPLAPIDSGRLHSSPSIESQHIKAERRVCEEVQEYESRRGEHEVGWAGAASDRAHLASVCDAYAAGRAERDNRPHSLTDGET